MFVFIYSVYYRVFWFSNEGELSGGFTKEGICMGGGNFPGRELTTREFSFDILSFRLQKWMMCKPVGCKIVIFSGNSLSSFPSEIKDSPVCTHGIRQKRKMWKIKNLKDWRNETRLIFSKRRKNNQKIKQVFSKPPQSYFQRLKKVKKAYKTNILKNYIYQNRKMNEQKTSQTNERLFKSFIGQEFFASRLLQLVYWPVLC